MQSSEPYRLYVKSESDSHVKRGRTQIAHSQFKTQHWWPQFSTICPFLITRDCQLNLFNPSMMDPLMEESFFIENPEKLQNNFFNQEIQKQFSKNFSEKSKEIVKVASMKNRHARKLKKKSQKANAQPNNKPKAQSGQKPSKETNKN